MRSPAAVDRQRRAGDRSTARPAQADASTHEAWVRAVLAAFERFRVLCAVREGEVWCHLPDRRRRITPQTASNMIGKAIFERPKSRSRKIIEISPIENFRRIFRFHSNRLVQKCQFRGGFS